MSENRIVYLAKYKAQLIEAAEKSGQSAAETVLPDADRLWELLDRNISLSVWMNER